MNSIEEILTRVEDLDKELVPFIVQKPFPMIKHPLIFELFYNLQSNALVNARFR